MSRIHFMVNQWLGDWLIKELGALPYGVEVYPLLGGEIDRFHGLRIHESSAPAPTLWLLPDGQPPGAFRQADGVFLSPVWPRRCLINRAARAALSGLPSC